MQIQEALGVIGLSRQVADIATKVASEAPTLAGDEIAAAYVYEAGLPFGRNPLVKILAIRDDGCLLLISWDGKYSVRHVPTRNIGSVEVDARRRNDGTWSQVEFKITLLQPSEEGDSKVEFPSMLTGETLNDIYETDRADAALMGVAEALSERL